MRQIGAPDSGPSIRAPPSPPLDTHGWLGFVAAADPIVARRLPIARCLHSPVLGFVEGERGRTQEGERQEGERTREGEGKSTGDGWMRLQPFASPFSSCPGGILVQYRNTSAASGSKKASYVEKGKAQGGQISNSSNCKGKSPTSENCKGKSPTS